PPDSRPPGCDSASHCGRRHLRRRAAAHGGRRATARPARAPLPARPHTEFHAPARRPTHDIRIAVAAGSAGRPESPASSAGDNLSPEPLAPSPEPMPTLVSSSRLFAGKVFDVDRDVLRFEDGREVTVDVVRHRASVVLVPMTDDGKVVLVRQYRHAVGRWLWELPAGTTDAGEDVEAAA